MHAYFFRLLWLLAAVAFLRCSSRETGETKTDTPGQETFGDALSFLKKHTDVIVLTAPDNDSAQVAVVGAYQGRVMTSTATGKAGSSYGWLNRTFIAANRYEPHMNAYGGEDRIWLSPEGGQFSVYFRPGAPFDFASWQAPAIIDTVRYRLVRQDKTQALFSQSATLVNHSGTRFDIRIDRKITVLPRAQISRLLGVETLAGLQVVGYETENTLRNEGADWQRDKGALGIWILGMFNPSPQTTIIAPFTKQRSASVQLTDNYFGKIPTDRLQIQDSVVLLRADGTFRSKIGIAPASARPVAGSYDPVRGILTLVQFDLNPTGDYLKSAWERHKEPYKGDVLNAYNDGPLTDGSQMGPFYELESNSAVRPLKRGDSLIHHHRTFHVEGDRDALQRLAQAVLGVDLRQLPKWPNKRD
ncbi:DUF6786 family protein [Spirosoma utsteinense]|uniref:Lipoprotein n=1 Tax=Spirosoma utsteinense TaxID=2585773 RepID=A0ABR6W1N2_9BACT|nr:DUF6786 family protein [Spirosoma utsteinense]MBC3789011.1 hypothetical protein [Spirosoma utsteinense]MBC3790516.1 hypothetical protein [Spirosoma utsteinense]